MLLICYNNVFYRIYKACGVIQQRGNVFVLVYIVRFAGK